MLISDARQIVFVHVPKTGGVSIEQVLLEACDDARLDAAHRHAPLARILRNHPETAGYWKFGFVRNPWARMVSWYAMIDKWNRRHGPASGKPQDVRFGTMKDGNELWRLVAGYRDFEEFVLRGPDEHPRIGRAQIDYLRAPRRAQQVDFIGRTESLAQDLQTVQRHLGVEVTEAPHRNKSSHGTYHDYYSDAARRKVAEVYAADVEAFGYTFD